MPAVDITWEEVEAFAGTRTATGIAVAAASGAVAVSLVHSFLHLHFYTHKSLQRYSVRILLVVAVYAVGSLLSLLYPEHALYFATVRDLYEAFVLYCFLHLMIGYGGGDSAIVLAMGRSPGEMRHPWPLCRLAALDVGSATFLRTCKQGVIQFVIVKPVCAALSLAMLLLGYYESFAYQAVLLAVYNVSFSWALYYLYLFYLATRTHLAPHHPIRKFVAVKAVVFLTYWQSLAVATLPLPKEDAESWDNFILCVEMLFFAVVHCFAFSYREFSRSDDDDAPAATVPPPAADVALAVVAVPTPTGAPAASADDVFGSSYDEDELLANDLGSLCWCCRFCCCCCADYGQRIGSAFLDVFCIGDAIRDTYHSFNSDYAAYMIQSQSIDTRFVAAVLLNGGGGDGELIDHPTAAPSLSSASSAATDAGAGADASDGSVPSASSASRGTYSASLDDAEDGDDGHGSAMVRPAADPVAIAPPTLAPPPIAPPPIAPPPSSTTAPAPTWQATFDDGGV